MRVAIYIPPGYDNHPLVPALTTGFINRGDEVRRYYPGTYTKPEDWTQLACFLGLGSRKIYIDHMKDGRHTLIIEPGYLNPKKYFRLAVDGYQSRFIHDTPKNRDRLYHIIKEAGKVIAPFRPWQSTNILYLGPNQEYCDWHALGLAQDFDAALIREVVNTMPIRFSIRWAPAWPEGEPFYMPRRTVIMREEIPLEKLMLDCHSVITHGHPAAVTALLLGLPVTLTAKTFCPIWPAAERHLDRAWNPHWPSDDKRIQTLANLAWCEFTLEEIASGMALETLEPYTVKRIERMDVTDPNDLNFIIEQYKLMHERGNRYRGGLADDVIEHIKEMVVKTRAKTLLDYGCGKGRQYYEHESHKEWGDIMPELYDPGYEPYSKRPNGKFDGVICTDVAEHLPEDKVDWFLADVINYAKKFVVFCIFTGAARKTLPDGRNAHLTIKSPEWWLDRINKVLTANIKTMQQSEDTYDLTNDRINIRIVFRAKE